MYPLFESICLKDGICQNLDYHVERFEQSYFTLFKSYPTYPFWTEFIPEIYQKGVFKLKVIYNQTSSKISIKEYQPRQVITLKLVQDDSLEYGLKFTNRKNIDDLYKLKKEYDDILIVKNGLITDTSICNIVFWNGSQWCTPDQPLLKGTQRERLIREGIIVEEQIRLEDLKKYQSFKLINAMKAFEMQEEISIRNINE